MRASRHSLPFYPTAMAKGNQILVIQSNGDTTILNDKSHKDAKRAAKTVQKALQATSFAKQRLADAVDSLAHDLIDLGVPPDTLDEVILDSYDDLRELILQLRETKTLLYFR